MVPMDVTKMTRRWTRVMHATNWFASAAEYWLDTCQKSLIYADILRKRGNIYIEHAKQGMPPVPVFDYETIVEGRDLERPVNYALVAIIDRRTKKPRRLKSRPERRKKGGGARDLSKDPLSLSIRAPATVPVLAVPSAIPRSASPWTRGILSILSSSILLLNRGRRWQMYAMPKSCSWKRWPGGIPKLKNRWSSVIARVAGQPLSSAGRGRTWSDPWYSTGPRFRTGVVWRAPIPCATGAVCSGAPG